MCSVHKQKPLMTYFTDYARTMVVLRLSFFSSFLLFIWTSWLWKFLGQHSWGLGLYSFLLFFSLFFFLFLFSRKAVQVFFLLCESPVILKTLTLIRKFLPFHTQTVQTSFFFFYVLVEPHMLEMREVSVFCFCFVLMISMIRCFLFMPALLFYYLMMSLSTMSFLNSETHRPHTRNIGTQAVEVVSKKLPFDPFNKGYAVAAALTGVVTQRACENDREVPAELRGAGQAASAGKAKAASELAATETPVPPVVQTMQDQALASKMEAFNQLRREQAIRHGEEWDAISAKVANLAAKIENTSLIEKGFTEVADNVGIPVTGVSVREAKNLHLEAVLLESRQAGERFRSLISSKDENPEELSTALSHVVMPKIAAILEKFSF